FLETAHAAGRAADLPGGQRLLTGPFLRQAALAFPLLALLVVLVALSPGLLAEALPAAVGDSYELGTPYGLVLGALGVALATLVVAALVKRLLRARARAAPAAPEEESA
ncbi:MAG TPA: hypothetical protein VNZ52_13295, partial [Candidatus Thermoplasmatota archaeon]|nr:hypothetical protein [Candidatus Thermoplasmatota archaeon]